MVAQLPDHDQISTWSDTEFAGLSPSAESPLSLPGFESGEFDVTYKATLHYVRELLKGALKDEVGSPIFRFVIEEDMSQLSTGAKKWVGIIPREITAASAHGFAVEASKKLTAIEKKRLKLKGENVKKLQKLIQNTITSILHYNLKAASSIPALNVALDGEKNFISYETLEAKVRVINDHCEVIEAEGREPTKKEYDHILRMLLTELGTLPEDADPKNVKDTLETLNTAKGDAWKLYKWLGENIKRAQEKASITGPIADIDVNGDHPSLHLIEHLRAMYGLSKHYGKSVEDRYELQTAGNLTWLMARLSTHPIYRDLVEHKDDVIHNFMRKVYHEGNLFKKDDQRKKIYLDKKNRRTTLGHAHNTWEPEVYDSLIEGFDDLSRTTKQVYRGGFRDKDGLSILLKAIKDRKELNQIVDALAGEAVMTGIEEKDLDPSKNGNALRLQAFIQAQAEGIAAATGLKRAPQGTHYRKIPKGTFTIVSKLEKSANLHSFNFPTVKIYFNIPVDDDVCDSFLPITDAIVQDAAVDDEDVTTCVETIPVMNDNVVQDIDRGDKDVIPIEDNTISLIHNESAGKSIRTEYRLICLDTWLRANKQTDSMSYNDNYKMKQGIDLLDIETARAYNDTIHPAATKARKWFKRKEKQELAALNKAS